MEIQGFRPYSPWIKAELNHNRSRRVDTPIVIKAKCEGQGYKPFYLTQEEAEKLYRDLGDILSLV